MSHKLLSEHVRDIVRRLTFRSPTSEVKGPSPASAARREQAFTNRLQQCEEEIERLRFENEQLRISATAFGELAERLNQALKTAVRSGGRGRTPIPRSR